MRGWQVKACLVAVGVGLLARLLLIHTRSLWFDEVLTVTLARRSLQELFVALGQESNAPVHYLLAKMMLAPLGGPGHLDFAVRYLSLVAAVLHLPLLGRIARRLGRPEAAWPARAVFALSSLAVYFGSEARAYALGSLLVLWACDRALALAEAPSVRRAVLLGAVVALAFYTHHNSLFVIAGLAWLFRRGWPQAKAFALAMATALALLSPWIPTVLKQPRGAVMWMDLIPPAESVPRLVVNLFLLVDREPPGPLLPVALLVGAATAWLASRRPGGRELLGVVGLGLIALSAVALMDPAVLAPQRILVPFLPLVSLLLGMSHPALPAVVAAVSCLSLVQQMPVWMARTPQDNLAQSLEPLVRSGFTVGAVGIYARELDYKLNVAHPGARVLYFPPEVALHSWHDDREPPTPVLRAQAAELLTAPRPLVLVLPFGARASTALKEALPADAVLMGRSAYVELIALPARP
jgi:hypothetical protein